MKAMVYHEYGLPDNLDLQDLKVPAVKDDQVLVKVHAASVNWHDQHFLTGTPFMARIMAGGLLKPRNRVLGSDVAGRVEAVGADVKQYRPAYRPGCPSERRRTRREYSMEDSVIEARNFRKTYGDFVAVDGISFDVQQGEIFGLLGPNGAGKTSTLESLEGLRAPDGGTLRVAGVDPTREPRKLRNLIGVQLQSSGLPESITPDEAMKFFCAYHSVAPRTDLLERLGVGEKRKAQFHELSTGQQRRLALALAVAHNPPVLMLDEPTAGLDVASRVELHDLMRELQGTGTTIILATHDMAEAEEMSDRVAILLKGKLATTGTPMEITATGAGLTKVSVRTGESSLSDPGLTFPAVSQHASKEEYSIYFSTGIGPTVSAIIAHIDAQEDTLIDLRVERPSLEDRFLEITRTESSNAGGAQ